MAPEYENGELNINPTQVFSVHNLTLKPNQSEEPPFTDHMKAICNLFVHVDSKAPKPSSQTEEVPQGKMPGATTGLRRKKTSKHTSKSKTEAFKSYLANKTKSARDGLKTAHTDSGASKKSKADEISKKIKLEDLSDILKDTRSAFFPPDSPTYEPIIVSDVSEEEKNAENDKDIEDT
ncbi:hypothetical protein Tco_1171605, partial [Tanacetum coccineum]